MHSAVKPTTQIHTHMCYSEFNDIITDIDAMDADVISFEASRGDLVVLDAIHDATSKPKLARASTISTRRASRPKPKSRNASTKSSRRWTSKRCGSTPTAV